MKKSTAVSILFFSILSGLWANANAEGPKEVENWFKRLSHVKQPEKMTKLHFYFHDLLRGKTVTSAVVAQANMTGSSPTFFGSFIVADDPLTVGPELLSKRVGYAKGFYAAASLEEVGLVMALTFVFTDEVYNGSSLSVLGHNPDLHMYREMPIVGGSGMFRLARGVATLQTYFFNAIAGNATVEVDIVILHY
ncbi:hypothetical protein Pfo_002893 [Paulownia fortunei]|nr:hypothetical protein Pfo_002893 [Paulownia fortunei]